MSQEGLIIRYRTDKDSQFTGTLAQNAAINVTVGPSSAPPVPAAIAAGMHNRSRLRSIRILSKENLAWELWLFGNSLFATANADTMVPLGRWTFVAADGVQATGDTYFFYYVDGLDVAIQDLDNQGQLNIRLVNRSVAGKSAGAAGEIVVELGIEPTTGW